MFGTGYYASEYPYTDLALERRRADTHLEGVEYKREIAEGGLWERLKINSEEGARGIGRPMGTYDTLQLMRMDLLDGESIDDATDEVAKELCYLTEIMDVLPERILVVGLGNPKLTPDAIGSAAASRVRPTMHVKEFDERFFKALECSEIAVVTPQVISVTGFDAARAIRALSDELKVSLVIVIDALAARSAERLGSTVQLSDTGLVPGSGLGNGRLPISKDTVGLPVISIGIPTVIDSRMLLLDGMNDNSRDDKKEHLRTGMFVSPKEINEIVDQGAKIIGGAINQAFGLYYR